MSAEGLLAWLAGEGLTAQAWANGPNERYTRHAHDYDKVIVAVEGSIVFGLPETDQHIELRSGDRLELPAGTLHEAFVGPDGVGCLEAHRPAGTLPAGLRRRAAGDW
jgi:quercetin dioxygenase-like cupin family protein